MNGKILIRFFYTASIFEIDIVRYFVLHSAFNTL